MQNVLKPFGEKDTGSLSGSFHRARVRLTCVYVAILAIILCLSSSILYSAFSKQLERRFERFRPRPTFILPEGIIPPSSAEVRADLIDSLIMVNGFLLLLAGLLSYHLAGMTLEPIQIAYQRQRRFLSDASHELRTPLAILQTDLENELQDTSLSTTEQEQRKSNLEEVERMGRLVSDLLLLSRFDEEGSTQQVSTTIVDLNDIVRTAVTRLEGVAKRHHVSLHYTVLSESLKIQTQSELLLHALTNILQNAIAYNVPDGTVAASLTVDENRARITITDTGIGIAKEDLAKIFERFYRTDKSRSRQTGGSGLGLSIVQSLLKRLGGSVDIQSTVHKGTVVTVYLPLSPAS
jgi:signal transduction histidine kinase